MKLQWYQRNQEAVVAALKRGERPDMATTMSSGPLDDLVALHDELGMFDALDDLPISRQRRGIEDALLLRTTAVLPFLDIPSLSGAAGQLFKDPAILLHLGWSPLQIWIGDNERHRSPHGRCAESLPCHPETLRDELARVAQSAWQKVQESGVQALFDHRLVRGSVYAIDGTGLGKDLRLVCLVCVSAQRPVIVAWRLLSGTASEKGKEAAVTRCLIEQAQRLGGPDCIRLLLVDALYADGPLLAWCKYARGIDVLVPVPSDREIYRDLAGLAEGGLLKFKRFSYVRTIQGHKCRRTLEAAAQAGLTSWDSFVQAARGYGAVEPALWGCLIRPVDPTSADDKPWTLVSTRVWPNGEAGFQAYRPRWHIENDTYRELKEGWHLEEELWGKDAAVQQGRVTLTCLAFNTAQVYLSQSGERLAAKGIRRLRQHYRPELGANPTVIYIGRNYAVLPLEELLTILGHPVCRTLRPNAAARPP
jgi:hypothetical protein